MNWDFVDFAVFGAMVVVALGLLVLLVQKTRSQPYRIGTCLTLLGSFLLIWVNGAVGIIGSENNPANLMFGAVLLAGLVVGTLGRFEAGAMARALLVVALVHLLVAAVALIGGMGAGANAWPWDVVVSTGIFVAVWLLAAGYFRRAGREQHHHQHQP